MKPVTDGTKGSCAMDRLESIQMSDHDRLQARECIHQAERFAGIYTGIEREALRLVKMIFTAIAGLGHSIKAGPAKPVRH